MRIIGSVVLTLLLLSALHSQEGQPVQPIVQEKPDPCKKFPAQIITPFLTPQDDEFITKPDEKIDYKMIVINPCLPAPAFNLPVLPPKENKPNGGELVINLNEPK